MVMRFHTAPALGDVFQLEREIGNLFDELLSGGAGTGSRYPALDVAERENETVVVAELPGMKKDDIRISVHDGMLTVSGERKAAALPEDGRWIRNEIPAGRFSRSVLLPHDVNVDAVSAELSAGVLRVTLPKVEAARPREIRVK